MWITRVSINNPVFATMVMVALCVLGLFSYCAAGRRAAARHLAADRLRRRRLPGRLARGGRARADQADRGGAEQHRRRQEHHARAASRGAARRVVEFTAQRRHGRARCRTCATSVARRAVRASRATPRRRRRALRQRQRQPMVRWRSLLARRAARASCRCSATRSSASGSQRVEGVRAGRRRRPDDARGAHRPRPAAPARLRLTPARDRRRAAARPTPTSRSGLLTDATQDAILRVEGRVRDPKRVRRRGGRHRNGLALTLGDLGTLVEREREPDSMARIDGVPAISSRSSSSRTPTSSPPARRSRRRRRSCARACRPESSCA